MQDSSSILISCFDTGRGWTLTKSNPSKRVIIQTYEGQDKHLSLP
ncbi:MAG: hypothetical protein DQL93_0105 (endogenous virus) [Lactobacillus phage ViSo-2018b]|nr:MAG: hypothetical protein DQL93_0105 [Lactobacillus phage ViSo-2018b]